jgi:pyruvate carboxylase
MKPPVVDLEQERTRLASRLGREVSEADLSLYLQFPFDALSYFQFEAKYGKTWLLPPEIWFRKGPLRPGSASTLPMKRASPTPSRSSPPSGKETT